VTLRLEDVGVRYGERLVVADVNLEISDGERLSVLGPSGSGKSTLLRAICGLEPLASGRISWDGEDLASVPVHRRGFGLMFQDYALFPHLTVDQNVAFGPEMAGLDRATTDERVAEALQLVRLGGYGGRLPTQLSGGEQQRVALARAIAPRPRLLMLDEPLGALDRTLRRDLLDELITIFKRLNLPIIYVTHDHEEALAVGDRVAVMRDGRVEAVATPADLWDRPPTEFAARFLGLNNIVHRDGRRMLLRPDAFTPDASGELEGTVESTVFRGSHTLVRVTPHDQTRFGTILEIEADWSPSPTPGDRVRLRIDPAKIVELGS
jgi:thiamine transport system ATP-binding protein